MRLAEAQPEVNDDDRDYLDELLYGTTSVSSAKAKLLRQKYTFLHDQAEETESLAQRFSDGEYCSCCDSIEEGRDC